jgi:RNA polymerase primary sigma factor
MSDYGDDYDDEDGDGDGDSDEEDFEEGDTKSKRSRAGNEEQGEDDFELCDLIQSPDDDKDDFYQIDEFVKNELERTLSVLTIRERSIIDYYYGLNKQYEPMTLEAIGEKFGLTKERIRQIKQRALMKLRHNSFELFNILNG